jgi:hypothetical protein
MLRTAANATVPPYSLSLAQTRAMKRYFLFFLLAGIILGCKKNSQNSTLSGVYVESSPLPGNILLNFTSSSTVSIAEKNTINQERLPLGNIAYQLTGNVVKLISTATGKPYSNFDEFLFYGTDSLVFLPCCCGLPCPSEGPFIFKKIFTP